MNPAPTPRKRSPWPYAIVGLLGAHVSAMVLAVHVAGGSSGHTLLPEYHDRGSTWDEARAAAVRSDALGWTLAVVPAVLSEAAVLGDGTGQRRLGLVLRDAAGDPVSGAAVTVRSYHCSVGERCEAAASALEGGDYVVLLPMERPGAYEVETVATLDGLEFRDTRRVDVVSTLRPSATETRPARGGQLDTAR
jgi:hypothetical protein